ERRPLCEDHVGLQCDQFFRLYLRLICAAIGCKASVHADIATLRPSTLFKPLPKSREARRHFRIVLGQGRQHRDPANSVGLLRARRERPCGRRATEQRDELAAGTHSITSSARARSVGGTSRPSDLAVLRLMTSSTFVTCCTGKSAGFSPLR